MAYAGELKNWACVYTPYHIYNRQQKSFPCGLSVRWFNVVSNDNYKDPDFWRDLSVMYLVVDFSFFEECVLQESTVMYDIEDYSLLLLLLGFFSYYFTSSGLIQCSAIDILVSYCDSLLLFQISSSLLIDT